MTADILVT